VRRRAELAEALTTAERLLRASAVDVDVVDPRAAVAQSALDQYFGELDDRFRGGIDPGDDSAAFAALRAPEGAFLVMCGDRVAVGCGGVQRVDTATGEIKRMWIHPDWRGLGLGGRLLARLEDVARDLGRTRVVLDTNATLVEAIAMYERAGYRSIERYNDNPYAQRWFAKDL
jgi:GNAT superfamily N-acetyltransferase